MRLISILALSLCFHSSYGQTIYTSKKDISAAKEITFYGYDFSHFTLADAKRLYVAQDRDPAGVNEHPVKSIKVYVSAWVGYLLDKMDDNYFARKLKTSKVTFDFDHTLQVIRQLNDSNLVSFLKTTIHRDSIQTIVSNYQVKQKEGIGFAIIVECFNKDKEASSAYFTFFDIATKKVIMADYFSTSHADGIGLTKHWGYGFHYTVDSYMSHEFKSNARKK
ncbi:MAG: hypothetical protein IPL84_11195 [Chitinophagaceae bacterium]|nr:hypothetical protein [Chitinophagaceae bacterium]